jgi:hypothetical protein
MQKSLGNVSQINDIIRGDQNTIKQDIAGRTLKWRIIDIVE